MFNFDDLVPPPDPESDAGEESKVVPVQQVVALSTFLESTLSSEQAADSAEEIAGQERCLEGDAVVKYWWEDGYVPPSTCGDETDEESTESEGAATLPRPLQKGKVARGLRVGEKLCAPPKPGPEVEPSEASAGGVIDHEVDTSEPLDGDGAAASPPSTAMDDSREEAQKEKIAKSMSLQLGYQEVPVTASQLRPAPVKRVWVPSKLCYEEATASGIAREDQMEDLALVPQAVPLREMLRQLESEAAQEQEKPAMAPSYPSASSSALQSSSETAPWTYAAHSLRELPATPMRAVAEFTNPDLEEEEVATSSLRKRMQETRRRRRADKAIHAPVTLRTEFQGQSRSRTSQTWPNRVQRSEVPAESACSYSSTRPGAASSSSSAGSTVGFVLRERLVAKNSAAAGPPPAESG
eukprot:CAMPEP_0178443564 /NCGR_PEP_ID=MMETSP0689_2-20121128/38971_1 /TAXON_ID=160604 /ORGANISM="Amphidinium massartii, Strain CS-259" /LENGTH=409 /DNA_ID=CAMNT_0020067597 /DNA_START=87 /DNA_END=1313 /DNA_ORIENTATION=-